MRYDGQVYLQHIDIKLNMLICRYASYNLKERAFKIILDRNNPHGVDYHQIVFCLGLNNI